MRCGASPSSAWRESRLGRQPPAQQPDVAAQVKEPLRASAPGAPEAPARRRIREHALHRVREGRGIARWDEVARLALDDDLRDAGERARDDGDRPPTRVEQDGRERVDVAVRGDDAGQGDHRRGSHLARDLLDGKTSAQPDGALEAELGNQLPKDRLLDAGADDLAAEANAPPPEDAAGLDQDGEPLLLDQPPDPEDAIRRALGG